MSELAGGPREGTTPRPRRRRRLRRWLMVAGVVLVLVLVLMVIVAVIADRRLNPPIERASVPSVTLPSPAPGDPAVAEGRILFDSDRTGSFEIFAMAADGADVVQLTDDPDQDAFWPRLSPDRKRILFYRVPAGSHNEKGEYQETSLWMMRADGGAPTLVLPQHAFGWHQQGHAEWAPDGQSLVMFAGRNSNPQIWVTDTVGRLPQQLTDEPGTNVDPVYSPDGTTIAYVGCPARICLPSDQEIYTIPAVGGQRQRLTDDGIRDHDPYYSPDGSRLAFLSQTGRGGAGRPAGVWNIRLMDAGGNRVTMLTDDGNINSKPSWSLDGMTIYFHRLVYGRGDGFQIWAVDVATGVLTEITAGERSLNEYPGT